LEQEIARLTTAGAQTKTITAIGFSENLNLYAANSFPSSRAGMSSAMSITTAAGRTSDFTTAQGMMASQIATKFNAMKMASLVLKQRHIII
jgi:hypothetical protein